MGEAKAVWQRESDAALEFEREKWQAEHACKVNEAVEEIRSRSQRELEVCRRFFMFESIAEYWCTWDVFLSSTLVLK